MGYVKVTASDKDIAYTTLHGPFDDMGAVVIDHAEGGQIVRVTVHDDALHVDVDGVPVEVMGG